MKISILYDNEAEEGFKSSWGFSCLVGDQLLFDVGADMSILLFNMRKASVKLNSINRVVLSHEHGDHVGGIGIVRMLGDVEVFIPTSFSSSFKRMLAAYENVTIIEIDETRKISNGFITTGELGRFIKEQSMIVETDNGLTVVTGCSHPNLEKILKVASKFGNIYGVVGGFHGFSRLKALGGVKLIVPCHCTSRKAQILNHYPQNSKRCAAGLIIKV